MLPFRNLMKMTLCHNSNVLCSLQSLPGVSFPHPFPSLSHLHLSSSYSSKSHSKHFLRETNVDHLACKGPLLCIPEAPIGLHYAQQTWSKSASPAKPTTQGRGLYLVTCSPETSLSRCSSPMPGTQLAGAASRNEAASVLLLEHRSLDGPGPTGYVDELGTGTPNF